MDSLKVTFDGADGAPLAARLEMPGLAPAAFALFAHCFTCGKDSSARLATPPTSPITLRSMRTKLKQRVRPTCRWLVGASP